MDDLAPAPEAPVEWGEIEEPRVPQRLFALKDSDTFLVADASATSSGPPTACSTTTPASCRAGSCCWASAPPTLLSRRRQPGQRLLHLPRPQPAHPGPRRAGRAARACVHLERKRFLWDERLYERIR